MAKMTSPIHIETFPNSNLWKVWASDSVMEQIRALPGVGKTIWSETEGYWHFWVDPRYDLQALLDEMLNLALDEAKQDSQA